LDALPNADILMGKPAPSYAVRGFLKGLGLKQEQAQRVQWLVDTPERLEELQCIAKELGLPLRVNLEVDVGLHRGGFSLADFGCCIRAWPLGATSGGLSLSGLMGYDAHVGKVPWQSADLAHRRAAEAYAEFVRITERVLPELAGSLCLNGSGSPTFQNLTGQECWNEVTIGSAFVKPTDFDIKLLREFEPAAFIATLFTAWWSARRISRVKRVSCTRTITLRRGRYIRRSACVSRGASEKSCLWRQL
jgi:hypothetical protein